MARSNTYERNPPFRGVSSMMHETSHLLFHRTFRVVATSGERVRTSLIVLNGSVPSFCCRRGTVTL